jgi:hypothetical protein
LLVAPDDRQEAPPDWVQQQPVEPEVPQSPTKAEVSTEPAAAQSTAEQPVPAEFIQSPDASLPDWLKGLDPSTETSIEIPGAAPEKVDPPTKEASQASEAAISDWIRGLDEEKKPEPPAAPVKPEPPAEKPPVERRRLSRDFGHTRPLPSWLTSTTPPPAPEKPAPAPEPVAPSEEHPLPDWLREEKADSSEPPLMVPTDSSSDEGPALPDWLKNIGTEPEEPLAVTPILNPILQPILPLPALEISAEPAEMLRQAQLELAKGHIDRALLVYDRLIQLEQHLEEIIHDLRDALYRYPVEISIWQTLGDAYIRNNRVQDALDAYTKAEELLR